MAIRDEYGYTRKTVAIGDWNMDTTTTLSVAHGLSATEWKTIRNIQTTLRDDIESAYTKLEMMDSVTTGILSGGVGYFDATNIELYRYTGGRYDGTDFDSTSYNRGWVEFEYIAD